VASSPQFGATTSPAWRPEDRGPPEIDPQDLEYEEDDFLGEGTFGKVYRGRCRGKAVAVKVPLHQNLREEELSDFRKEVSIMSKIFHPNVVLFMGASTKPNQIKIVTELMSTDLEKLLHSPDGKKLSLYQRIKMAKDAALGMNWLHGINKIVHRDLKPANLLVDDNFRVKVTDFGFSEVFGKVGKDKFGPRGTALWMAPEVMQQQEFDETVDVYSFGIVVWEIYSLEEPFKEYSDWDEFFEAVCIDGDRPAIDDNCPTSLKELTEACWHKDRKQRPSFQQIVLKLDEVLVDVAITDPPGRTFWKKYFLEPKQELQDKVSWRDFTRALSRSTKIKDKTRFNPLKELLVNDKSEVTIQQFNNNIIWFGEFFKAEVAKDYIAEITEIVKQPWFHGDIDKGTAESRLDFRKVGTFLVRLSTTMPQYPYTISMIKKVHKRIKRTQKADGTVQFSIATNKKGVKTFDSLITLIQGCSKDLHLKIACTKDVFENPYL